MRWIGIERHAEELARDNRAIPVGVCHFDVASPCPLVHEARRVPLFVA